VTKFLQSTLLHLYGLLQRVGILESRIFQDFFIFAYFTYKKHLEDPFATVVANDPAVFTRGNILDVGGNVGYTAVLFSTVIGAGFKVFSFEPEAHNFTLLTRVIQAKQLQDKIVPVRAAVGNQNGWVDLWVNRAHPADHRVLTPVFSRQLEGPVISQNVPIWTLDAFLEDKKLVEPVSFIKVDVQGYEWPVCQGMTNTLRQNPRVVVALEYAPAIMRKLGFDPSELLDFFREMDFLVYLLSVKEGFRQSSYPAIPELVLNDDYVDLVFSHHPLERAKAGLQRLAP
jgi:FkbM family methyltransferase